MIDRATFLRDTLAPALGGHAADLANFGCRVADLPSDGEERLLYGVLLFYAEMRLRGGYKGPAFVSDLAFRITEDQAAVRLSDMLKEMGR